MKPTRKIVTSALVLSVVLTAVFLGAVSIRKLLSKAVQPATGDRSPVVAWLPARKPGGPAVEIFDLHRTTGYPLVVTPTRYAATLGWSPAEELGRWVVGRQARLDCFLKTIGPRTLVFNTNSGGGLLKKPQRTRVGLNGHPIGEIVFSDRFPLKSIVLPAEFQTVGLNHIDLRFDYTRTPKDQWGVDDIRPLAAWVRSVVLLDGESGPLIAGFRTVAEYLRRHHVSDPHPSFHIDPNGRPVVRGNGTLVVTIDPAENLELEISPGNSLSSITVTAHDFEGRSRPANLIPEQNDGEVSTVRIRLPEGMETAFLRIDVTGSEDPITLDAPWLRDFPAPSRPSPPETSVVAGRPPNIVVLILDAARRDRFGCYGSDRPTTPNIDRLADHSIVFPDIVALAPYTLCSVPTMLTGLSFLEHGIVQRGQRLSEEALTLAEVLRDAGFETAAFSATPYNSRKLGTAQGYDVFDEVWRTLPKSERLDPSPLVARAVDWINHRPENRPFHLLIHMVPPHEPYRPGPEFDRFSDPNYAGPADGSRTFMERFNGSPLTVPPKDIEHIRDLYDGNLLKADAAVGRLLDALESRKDWNRTVVVVTSDHGESLGEHGRIGHNDQVFEPMIRVPLILRLPPGSESAFRKEALERTGSLADLAPTLAALAGQAFPGPMIGRDLFDPTESGERAHVIRTTEEAGTLGVRTAHWKLVIDDPSSIHLFDLEHDPGESSDCIVEHPVIAAGLRQILLSHLAIVPRFRAADEGILSEQDRDMLHSLGYLHRE